MGEASRRDRWTSGEAYERYVGRWSRLVAREFLTWLNAPAGGRWLDVGCGTGELSRAITGMTSPGSVTGIDPSEQFVLHAGRRAGNEIEFRVGDAQALPFDDGCFDATVSGLVLNFVPDPSRGAGEMARVTRRGGIVGSYVWNYVGEMQFMRHFWDTAVAIDPAAADLDERGRFTICRPERLAQLFEAADIRNVETCAIDVPTHFRDFEDYWSPLLGGQGPAGAYAMSLSEERRAALRDRIRARLPTQGDGSIRLVAKAWAVRGVR